MRAPTGLVRGRASAPVPPEILIATAAGLAAGMGALLGALAGFFLPLTHRQIAACMALGAGLLLATLSFELVAHALREVGAGATGAGLLGGALLFSAGNRWLAVRGAEDRKRCGGCVEQPTEAERPGSGSAIALGSALDAVPEAVVIGLTLRAAGELDTAIVIAFALANLPEGLASAAGMRQARRSLGYVLAVWGGVALTSAAAAAVGYGLVGMTATPPGVLQAVAAGALLALVVETMAPEAVANGAGFAGVLAAAGFLALIAAGGMTLVG